MPCESRQKGQVAGREGRRCTRRQREVHTGKSQRDKESLLPTFLVQMLNRCMFTFQRRVRASEGRSHMTMWEEEGTTETVN